MSVDEIRHLALPKLVGAPAFARPTPPVVHTPRPFDPDDLPIVAAMSEEELALAAGIPGTNGAELVPAPTPKARPFSLRAMADRLRGAGS